MAGSASYASRVAERVAHQPEARRPLSTKTLSAHHRFLAAAYWPLKSARAIGRPFGLARAHRLRVLLYHDVPPQDRPCFAAQMRWLANRWTFVTPAHFGAMVSGERPIRGSNILLTFDDGFASNRTVAEKILKPMGIRALFFVVSDFVALDDAHEARAFIARHILPGTRADALPEHLWNMRWGDLECLLEQGHSIGGHTRTHAMLSRLNADRDLEGEIVGGADMLEQRLGARVEHFAYTFGDVASFSQKALAISRRRFRFVYSGLRGDNSGGVSPFALRRDAVTASDPTSLLGAYLEGAADFRYAGSRLRLESWV